MVLSTFMQQAIVAFEEMEPTITTQQIDCDITDRFFCFVQKNRVWMKNYLETIAETGNLQVVNSQIAQYISKHYNLQNNGVEIENPNSILIQSYHELVPINNTL